MARRNNKSEISVIELSKYTTPIVEHSIQQRIFKALESALEVHQNRSRKISTSQLNDYLLPIIDYNPPPTYKGKYLRIKYVTQLPSQTPTFAFYCNLPQYIKDPYKRFLENKIREEYDLAGVSVRLFFRKK